METADDGLIDKRGNLKQSVVLQTRIGWAKFNKVEYKLLILIPEAN